GKNIANPIGAIASAAMLLRHTAKNETAAASIENAIDRVLAEGYRTADISAGGDFLSTSAMGELIAKYAVEKEASQPATQSN
ncbi:MAG: isocitrate/isopropylmalate family dehydrogenase, partial [Pyrinomonadaceae bacterium]